MKRTNDIRDIVHDGIRTDRAAAQVKIRHMPDRGATTYGKRKVVEIAAPMVGGAIARTIRIHELLHANHSPVTAPRKSIHPIAFNAIEDARVHSIFWPDGMPRRANRDCLATALADMRTIPPMALLGRAEDWNMSLLIGFRAMSILFRFNGCAPTRRWERHRRRLATQLIAAFGKTVVEKLCDILRLVKSRKAKAIREFTQLLRDDEPQEPKRMPGHGSDGASSASPMHLIRLPMPEACNSAIRRIALARSGARLNRARLANAIATGSTVGLFIRPRYLAGGTYLFDASGSMYLSDERLEELCRAVPAATVAYYSGWGGMKPDGAYGALVVYAENGRRASEIEHSYGHNDVDLYAIQWLLKQPAPRVYVGDGEFCGGPEGQDVQSAILLASAVANGEVTWYRSIADLETALET